MSALSLQLPATSSMTTSRMLHAYWSEARLEIVRTLRNPAFVFPTIALPVLLYVFFGVVIPGARTSAAPPDIGLRVLSGFAMFSAIGPGMFGMGRRIGEPCSQGIFVIPDGPNEENGGGKVKRRGPGGRRGDRNPWQVAAARPAGRAPAAGRAAHVPARHSPGNDPCSTR